jgi:hypothetical protein
MGRHFLKLIRFKEAFLAKNELGVATWQIVILIVSLITLPIVFVKVKKVIDSNQSIDQAAMKARMVENWDIPLGVNKKAKKELEDQILDLKNEVGMLHKQLCLLAHKTEQDLVQCQDHHDLLKDPEPEEKTLELARCRKEDDFAQLQGFGVCLRSPIALSVGQCLGEKLFNRPPGNFIDKIDGEYYCLRFSEEMKKYVAKRVYTGACYHVCRREHSICIGEIRHKGKQVPACIHTVTDRSCKDSFRVLKEEVCTQEYDPKEGVLYFTRNLLSSQAKL